MKFFEERGKDIWNKQFCFHHHHHLDLVVVVVVVVLLLLVRLAIIGLGILLTHSGYKHPYFSSLPWFLLVAQACPVSTNEAVTTESQQFNFFIRIGGNAIAKLACPEAQVSNPTNRFAPLWDRNPFRDNSNYWQVTQEEARRIIPSSDLDEVKLTCLYVSPEDTMENVSTYSSILFQPRQWMVENLELEKLAVLTPRKKPPLSSRMVG